MINDAVDVFALHGFLGTKDDWSLVFQFLNEEKPLWELHPVDVFSRDIVSFFTPLVSMEDWAQKFNAWVLKTAPKSKKRILIGYSMGGRLAMHALEANPALWSGAVLLSTHPGLTDNGEKLSRIEADRRWSQRFAKEELSAVLEDWNKQPVFTGSVEPERKLQSLDRQNLVHSLTAWSLGNQKDFRDRIDLWSVRQIWAAGEKDVKFSELLKEVPATQEIQKWVIEEATHRLVLEAPQEIAHFIARVGSPIPG